MNDVTFILKGVAGSQAHGLATPESDVDTHGVFSHATSAFWSLDKPVESIVTTDPDTSYHEVEKFLRLAAKSNPSAIEILWLNEYLEKEPVWGDRLLSIRSAFLSEASVRGAYLGYANDQFRKVLSVADQYLLDADKHRRARKWAKHVIRLVEQGYGLYTTGVLNVRVADPQFYFDLLDRQPLEEITSIIRERMGAFSVAETVLPSRPDFDTINDYLHDYRKNHQ